MTEGAAQKAAKGRNRSLVFSTASSGLARVLSIGINAATIPLVVRSIGAEGYGLWTTITSVSLFLGFADFGLSNGLVTVISEAHGKQDREGAIRSVSTTFFVLLAVAAALSILVVGVAPLVPWAGLLGLANSRLAPEVGPAVVWFLVIQLANLPAIVGQKVQIGYQEVQWTNAWQVAGSLFSLLGVYAAARCHLGLLAFMVLFALGPLAGQVLGSIVLFLWLRPWLFPRLSAVRWSSAMDLGGTGGIFVILQLFALLGNSTDQLILTRFIGLAAVAEYSVTQRLFTGTSINQLFLLPLWPAFGEAVASGDHVWARKALHRTLWISLALSAGSATIIALLAGPIATVWVPQVQRAPPALLLGFIAVSVVNAYTGTLSVFLNNRKTLRGQLWFYSAASLTALAAKLWFVGSLGISGVLWGTFAGYGLFYTYPAWRLANRTLNDLAKHPVTAEAF